MLFELTLLCNLREFQVHSFLGGQFSICHCNFVQYRIWHHKCSNLFYVTRMQFITLPCYCQQQRKPKVLIVFYLLAHCLESGTDILIVLHHLCILVVFFFGQLHWMPPRLEQVHDEAVVEYFSRIDDPQWEDLDLPARRSHGRTIESKL